MTSEIFSGYFPELSTEQKAQLAALYPLYSEWNARINVISRKDIENLNEKHVLHSMAIAKFISFVPGTKIMDVGTGGGFPGIPLAILFPESDFLLVDSIGKKLKVIEGVAESIGLKNVRTQHERAEKITEKFDFVVSRAVTSLPELLSWVKGKISKEHKNAIKNGILYLRGEDTLRELNGFIPPVTITKLSDFFEEEFFKTKILVHYITKS